MQKDRKYAQGLVGGVITTARFMARRKSRRTRKKTGTEPVLPEAKLLKSSKAKQDSDLFQIS